MKTLAKLLLLFPLLAFALNNCSSNKQDMPKASNLDSLPAWVLDPAVEGTIAAVGVAPKSRGNITFQIPKAEADARANIAAQINTEVSRLSKRALRESNINDVNDVEDVFTQATKNVVKKINLLGARRINLFKDPEDGSVYVHMAIYGKIIANYFAQNKDLFKEQVAQSSLGRERINQAQKAVDALFNELNEELK